MRESVTDGELDLASLGRAVWARKRWAIGLTVIAAAVAFAAVNFATPRYESEARVLIEGRENVFLRPEVDRSTAARETVDPAHVASQVQLILSRELALKVIDELGLAKKPEFDPVLDGVSATKVLLSLFNLARDPRLETPEERVLKSFRERLTVYPLAQSQVIVIAFESEDADLAAAAANAVARTYLVMQRAAKQAQVREAGEWLAGEIEKLRVKVAEAEARVEAYRNKTDLFVGGNNNTTLSNQQLGDVNGQLAAARAQRSDADSKARLIRQTLQAGAQIEFSEIINSELMRRLSEQRATLLAQLAEQSATLLGGHPRIKELKAQIADLERQMRSEAERLARSLESDARVAGARVDSLVAAVDQLKRQAAISNEQDVELRALEREAKSQRDLLESYLAKYREATARDSINAASPDARVISQASVSNTPAWPKKLPTILVAALAMLVMSTGFIVTGELLNGGHFHVGADAPMVAPARVPLEPNARDLSAAPRRRGWFSRRGEAAQPLEQPRTDHHDPLVTLVHELRASGGTGRRVVLVGMTRNVGTTVTAVALGRALAEHGSAVLVDLALGSPSLAAFATAPHGPGIAELQRGAASFGDIITRDHFSDLHLVLAGRPNGDPPELAAAQRLATALEALTRTYDYLLLDAGAIADGSLHGLAQFAPRAVLVAGDTGADTIAAARDQLRTAGFVNVTVIEGPPPRIAGRVARAA